MLRNMSSIIEVDKQAMLKICEYIDKRDFKELDRIARIARALC